MSDDRPVFSASNLGSFSTSFEDTDGAFSKLLAPSVNVKCDLIIEGGGKKAKAVIESMDDMKRLSAGEAVEVDWYRWVNDEWEFFQRHALKINKQGIPDET